MNQIMDEIGRFVRGILILLGLLTCVGWWMLSYNYPIANVQAASEAFVVDQTAIQATFYPNIKKYVVYVAFTGHNTLKKTYQMGTAHCGLFVEGKLVAPAVGVLMDIPALGTINGMAEGGLLDIKPDHAECTLSAAF